jgi:methionyl-tRNA formyltransferase
MTPTSKTIVFFGSGPVAAQSLNFLSDHFSIETVITKAVPAHHKELAPVEELAKQKGLPLLYANTKAELDTLVAKASFKSSLGIIVDYGVIVSQETIDAFPLGIVNSHFSLLPEWRGADPITFSILSGQKKTGVSLMLIEPSLDTGKLITTKSLQITPDETTPSLTHRLIELSNQLLAEYLPSYMDGNIKPHAQPHPDRATYSRKLTKQDSIIDWTKPAEEIEREVRAFQGWPGSKAMLAGKEVIITKAHVTDEVLSDETKEIGSAFITLSKELAVPTGKNTLVIDQLKPVGKKEMSGYAFIVGHKDKLQ